METIEWDPWIPHLLDWHFTFFSRDLVSSFLQMLHLQTQVWNVLSTPPYIAYDTWWRRRFLLVQILAKKGKPTCSMYIMLENNFGLLETIGLFVCTIA